MTQQPVALVTGANRGLGFATSAELARRGYHVVMTGRSEVKIQDAARALQQKGLAVTPFMVNVADASDLSRIPPMLEERFGGRLAVLVNNAGIMPGLPGGSDRSILTVTPDAMIEGFQVNLLGALMLSQAVLPALRRNGGGRIVNVSTGMAQLSDMGGGQPAYRVSKTALNAVTRIFAQELANEPIKVNCACPGWVQTDMGGPNAPRTVEEGIDIIVWLATLPDDGPTGGFFRDRQPLPW
ncbi:MAG TPA: SDR family oxidoreductase [Alphaproteobacteria bacterium]|nr:SDR family oxidoreductase [Alphaproteobacteria bacterium]